MKLKQLCFLLFALVPFFFLGTTQLVAQTLNKPIPADNPNIAGNSAWTAACASAAFNEYFVNFTWNPPLVNSDNSFILELSDATGSFDSPVELANDNTKNTNFDFEFQFALPTDTRGDSYRFRVRSTSPAATSPESDAFPMYYIDFDSPLLISQNGDGSIPPGGVIELCGGSTISLAPHNIPNASTYQYNWYRSSTLLPEKGPSIDVNQAGMYYVEVDYGADCSGSANTLSNTIEITIGASLGIGINPPANTDLCSGETVDLEADITGMGLTYVWYKDGVAITAPTVDDDTYTVDASIAGFEGDYAVEIDGAGTCLERSSAITITNAGDFVVTRDNADSIVLLPTQTETLSVSTTAGSPLYQWYRDGVAISGATGNSLDVTQTGVYYAAVTQSGGACTSTTKNSDQTTVAMPASLEIITDYATAYTACESTSIALEVTRINAVAGNGAKTDVTADLLSGFAFQWRKDGVAIGGATASTISLTDVSENGDYVVDGVLGAYAPTSNNLSVELLVNETLVITSSGTTSCSSSDPITINTVTDLSSATFDWTRDGAVINSSDAVLSLNTPGTYQLVVLRNGCPLRSNEIVISPLDESLISLDSPDNVIFPKGSTRTVRASGGTAYRWLDSNNVLLSDTDAVTFDQEGNYLLIANINNCEVTRPLTVEYLETFKVPNVITVNADGINDQWVIPNSYSNDEEINVIIYNDQGEEVLNEFGYRNNWPQSSTSFVKQNMVFFYKIRNATEVLKQGTITIIR